MRLLSLVITFAISCLSYTQDMTDQICKLYEAGKYKEVTATYGDQQNSLSYKGLFHVGLSYYKQGKDQVTIEIMDKCISRNNKDSSPLYIKGKALNFIRQYSKAVKSLNKAISLEGGTASYYTALGDSYMSMNQLDKALEAYQSATKHDDCPERPFMKIPLIHSAAGKNQTALEAYYTAKENIDKTSENYPSILYKIGVHESMNKDFFDTRIILEELIELDPTYYQAYPILIQANISLRKHEAVEPLKAKLYEAHEKGELKNSLKEKFCFEKFAWEEDQIIKAYERFESAKDKTYFKHIYEVKRNGTLAYSIQTKHTPEGKKPLALQKHIAADELTYDIQFDADCSYKELRTAVMNVITEKAVPVGK